MAISSTTLASIKLSMRITGTTFDSEITGLAEAALADMGLAGVAGENFVETNSLVLRAMTTYCKLHFGEPDEYDRLKKSYDEQKAQLATATGYTDWDPTEA